MYHPMINEQTARFKWLIDLIPTGCREAVSMNDLARLTGLPSADIRQQVLNARLIGVLICSGEQGYYFPENPEELSDYVVRRKRYLSTAKDALSPFEDVLTDQEEGDPG